MPVPVRRSRRRNADRWLLNAGAVLGSMCLVLAALALIFGITPLIFASGSMSPAIPTGSLALAVPAVSSEISPGEVVSVVMNDGVRLTHRVVAVDPSTGLVLKGDANAAPDLLPYTGPSVDRVLFSVPGLGYVASWLASPWALVLGGLLCAYLLYMAFFRRDSRRSSSAGDNAGDGGGDSATDLAVAKPGSRRRTWLSVGAIVSTLAVVVPLGAVQGFEATHAAWISQATSSSSIAGAVMKPTIDTGCDRVTGNAKAIKFDWTAPAVTADSPPLKGYVVTVQRNNGGTPPTMIGTKTSDTYASGTTEIILDASQSNGILGSLVANLLQLLVGFSYTYTVTVTAQYGTAGWTWNAQPYVNNVVSVSAGALGFNLAVKCS